MKLILAVFGIFLCLTHAHADNPFLPVSDNSSVEVPSAPQPSPPPPPPSKAFSPTQNQPRLVIREKTVIERRPGVSSSERPALFQPHSIIINQGAQNDGSQPAPIAVFVDEEREKERVALIPTPLLAQNIDDNNDNDNDNGQFTQNSQMGFQEDPQSQDQQPQAATSNSMTTFTLGVNVLGEPMLIAHGPLPEDGVPVLVKTSNGFTGMILKPVDQIGFQSMSQQVQVQQEQQDQLDPQDQQDDQSQQVSPQNPLNQNVFPEFGDSFEREMQQRALTRGQRPTTFLKISHDGTYMKIRGKTQDELNELKTHFDEMENSENDDNGIIWDPAAGIKATSGKTFEEQQRINQAQSEKLRLINGNQGKMPQSSPQKVILVSSDPDPRFPKAILQSSDPHPNAPRPILVASDPHKTLPQPILVEGKQIPASQSRPASKASTSTVSKTKSASHQKENVQSTETVAKKSGREMKVTLLESSEETD